MNLIAVINLLRRFARLFHWKNVFSLLTASIFYNPIVGRVLKAILSKLPRFSRRQRNFAEEMQSNDQLQGTRPLEFVREYDAGNDSRGI